MTGNPDDVLDGEVLAGDVQRTIFGQRSAPFVTVKRPGTATYTTDVRRLPDPTSRLQVSAEAKDRLGGAVPSPAAAFLLTLIALPSLFWLVTLKRTTVYTQPEEWLMANLMPQVHAWVQSPTWPQGILRPNDVRPLFTSP